MKKSLYFLIALFIGIFIVSPWNAKAIKSPALTHLEVQTDGGQGNFNLSGGKKSFTFGFSNSSYFANIIAEASDPSYQITGAGKVEVKDGANTINVVVTDPSDNSSETYTINLNFSIKNSSSSSLTNPKTSISDQVDSSETKKVITQNPETGAFFNISAIGIVSIGAFYIFSTGLKNKKFYRL